MGQIHTALKDYPALPTGIGAQFFNGNAVERTLESYENTLKIAVKSGDAAIAMHIQKNMEIIKRMPKIEIETDKLTYANTHGDYMITQLILGEQKIKACIDWTTACKHPVVWEIIRSYVYASPKCAGGEIDIPEFMEYIKSYMQYASLNQADLRNMANLFFYFYGQYYEAQTKNRDIFLKQADLSANLLAWLETHADELTSAIMKLSKHK